MKKTILIAAIFFGINSCFSWDSTAAKYFPLQVGNVWVYSGTATGYIYYARSYHVCKVTGTFDTLGHRYYRLQNRYISIIGTQLCGVMQLSAAVRIDSATMNVYQAQGYCSQNEFIIDSLRAKVNDSVVACHFMYYNARSTCIDTLPYFIFNQNFPAKKFTEFYGPGYSTIYTKGIGIVNSSYGYSSNTCRDTLRGCVINGVLFGDTNTLVGINKISSEVPEKFSLSQNYPNPFNPTTKIIFSIPMDSRFRGNDKVVLKVYDVLGREIQSLVNERLSPGTYEVDFDGSDLPSGIYFYKLESNSYVETKKMVLIK